MYECAPQHVDGMEMYKEDTPFITIIVPAYNVERYVERCLDSLAGQTSRNFKVVLVNDGSTDRTEEICKKYVSGFRNIFTYVRQENKGLGAARNTGLSMVKTPYVCFLDSDDWQDIRFVEKLEVFIDRLDFAPDMVFTLPFCYNEASRLVEYWMDKPLYDEIFAAERGGSPLSLDARTCPELYLLEVNANRKVYRTDFLRENRFAFPEGVKWEDIRPHVQLVHLAKSCVALPATGFLYRKNNSGQITAETGAGRLDILSVFEDVLGQVAGGGYTEKECSAVMNLICNYTLWMLEMTNMDYIQPLLEGLHRVYADIPGSMTDAFLADTSLQPEEKNKRLGLTECLRGDGWRGLADYEGRQNLYRYWSENGGKKKNLIGGGIQCIKDSGLKYTIKLLFRKILYRMLPGSILRCRK